MPTCPHCNAQVSDAAVYCGNCGATINSPATPVSSPIPHMALQQSPASPTSATDDLSIRLEKAMRRTELLSYAAAGLGVAILFAIIGIAFV